MSPDPLDCLIASFATGKPITKSEAKIVACFYRRPDRVVTHDQLITALYENDPNGGPLDANNNVKVFVSKLRHKGYLIKNIHGVGYRLQEDEFVA